MIKIAKTTVKTTTTKRPTYTKSDEIKQAEKKLAKWEKERPDEYESKYAAEIDALLDGILNRESFDYSLNSDPLYQQYKELYVGNGKKAMEDTVGKASALTGGYANSYAVTAGNQAYSEYLDGLNSVALDLRDRAYEKYKDEGDKLIEDINILRGLDGDDYEKYLGSLERYYQDGSYLLDKLGSMSDREYEEFVQSVEAWENDRDYAFKVYQDELDRAEFEKELAFKKEEAKRDQANKDREYKASLSKKSSTSSSSGSSSKSSSSKTEIRYPTSYGEFCLRTGYSGIMTNSEFGRSSQTKKKYGTYQKYLTAMYKKYG